MFYVWLAIIILLAFIEAMTINLTTIWFVISGLVSLVISFITDNFMIQLAVFCLLGIVLLITTRPFLRKFVKHNDVKTNADRIIGMKGFVTEKITEASLGEVKVDGKCWTAFSKEVLEKDTPVRILAIDGVKVNVERWED